jgi:hypothetical protein
MKMSRYLLPLTALTTVITLATGCGDGKPALPKATVTGIVTYQGKPLGIGKVVFLHCRSGQGTAVNLNADGRFTLSVFQGENQVTVESLTDEPGSSGGGQHVARGLGMPAWKSRIPVRYAEFATSGLTLDVKPDNNEATFVLRD